MTAATIPFNDPTTVATRAPTGHTLGSLREHLAGSEADIQYDDVSLGQVDFRLTGDTPLFVLGSREVPATTNGILAFAAELGLPGPFMANKVLKQWGLGRAQELLEWASETYPGSAVAVAYTDTHVARVAPTGRRIIPPSSLVDRTIRVLGTPEAPVSLLVDNPDSFVFDTVVPFDYDRAVGGDRRVGDLTGGGVSVEVNRKRNLAPTISTYTNRLVCTNGMTHRDAGLRIEGRGQSVEEVLAEFEALAQLAFSRAPGLIEAHYSLREHQVENPERRLRAIAREQGISPRVLSRLEELAASDHLPDNPSEFDILNMITSFANSEDVRNLGGRRVLEGAAGGVVADQAARCGHCQQKVAR